ncbi:tyrosine-protein phosphatase 10D-like [Centruroides vittatus]|uniref:tyrosine-protein phosphatase 10D-like n=1 Tax=Centruroides vittatus TaxID=120091 RepID=UPI00350EF920
MAEWQMSFQHGNSARPVARRLSKLLGGGRGKSATVYFARSIWQHGSSSCADISGAGVADRSARRSLAAVSIATLFPFFVTTEESRPEEKKRARQKGPGPTEVPVSCLSVLCLLLLTGRSWAGSITLQLPPEVLNIDDAPLHLDYSPAGGSPAPNLTFFTADKRDGVVVQDVLPGTEYTFHLFYTNISSYRVWTTNVFTEPDPPINLSVDAREGKVAELFWDPPRKGNYTGFKVKVIPLSDDDESASRDFDSIKSPFSLRDLVPGASYEARLYSVFHGKESPVFVSSNFTTKPSPPGRFIVWYRDNTTLLVLWQPPYPAGVFDRYQVKISPPDSNQSVLYVEKKGTPPGPAQAAFYGLVPGRAYNISVYTVSLHTFSDPTEAQYRTIPLPPTNVTVNLESITPYSFTVEWSPPKSLSEFDKYQVSLGSRSQIGQMIDRNEECMVVFDKDLDPGHTYEVIVKTISGNVRSWEITKNITTRPLPVMSVNSSLLATNVLVEWLPNNKSKQDSYMVKYSEFDTFNSDNNIKVVDESHISLMDLLPGRNYSIHVIAMSKGILSDPVVVYQATKPTPPVIESSDSLKQSLNISWKADVTSLQEWYSVIYSRNDTKEKEEHTTTQTWMIVDDLYPGATYKFNVYAVSNGLWSDPVTYMQTIAPKAPENVKVISFDNSSLYLSWDFPSESLVNYFIIRYRPSNFYIWSNSEQTNTTRYEIKNLTAGEEYEIEVTSASGHSESVPIKLKQTLYPNSIQNVKAIIDAYNITFKWAPPEGEIEFYEILYQPVKNNSEQKSQILNSDTQLGDAINTIIYNLKPGELYKFHFYAVNHNLKSKSYQKVIRTLPVIDSVINIVTDEHTTRTLGIKYTPTPTRNVVFDRYRIQLNDESVPAKEKSFDDPNRLIKFHDLEPGRLYNISIWTISDNIRSIPIHRQARLYPEPIKEVFPVRITDTEITLGWDEPLGDKDSYEVEYQDHQGHLIRNVTNNEQISYKNMKPHHNYTFLVTVISGYNTSTIKRSRPISQTYQTQESVPGKTHKFDTINIKPNEVTLKWILPEDEQNGIITGFKITYYVKGSSLLHHELFDSTDTRGIIDNLIPGKIYIFQIQAHTKVGPGVKSQIEFKTPIWAPPSPESHIFPIEVSHSTTSITVRFRKNFFSEIFGPIKSYAIIVAEDETKKSNTLQLPSWKDVQGQSKWPPYQTVRPYYPFSNILVEDFTIGSENCKNVKGYCNGPLKSGTKYKVKIRAFVSPTNFSDTVFSPPIQTDTDNKLLIIIVLVTLTLVLLIILIIVMLKRRGSIFSRKQRNSVSKEDNLSITESELITSRPIKLKDFLDHYNIMSADSDFRFSEEFELLKHVGREKLCAAADLPVNRPKNRFTNILPYDHSRVKLLPTDDEEGSDYINSNYIPGFNSLREFIVTQGPLHSTRDDFWRMVWEQNCRAIIMLTRCIEKGREKCDHYWPFDTQPVYYGDIQVTILNESQYPHWTISEFKVCRGEQSRIVRHFHFTTWPDFGVPDPPQILVKFVRAFRERIIPDSKPVVVHCSAGVGRSGTFIALDRLLQHIQKYDFVDIFGIVYEMRKERVWMVQNEQQYICIYQCLLCVLEGKEDILDSLRPEVHDNQAFEDDEGIAESGI